MSLYVVKPESLELERTWERSPVVSLLTNCLSEHDVPSALRDGSDRLERATLSILPENRLPEGVDATLFWLEGEKLLEGSARDLRRAVSVTGNCSFVPVHLPCFAEVDLIGLQPRIWKKGKAVCSTCSALRIGGNPSPSPEFQEILKQSDELWARFYSGLIAEQKEPGSGIEILSQLWHDSTVMPRLFGSLLVRNLIVLLIRHNHHAQAEKLLKLGMDYYPRYAELPYLAAVLCVSKERYAEVPAYVRQATHNPDLSYVGSGGEHSYRPLWLLGSVFERVGNQKMAIQCYLPGAETSPAFPPSVFGILRQRLPYSAARELRYRVLGALARHEPQYLEAIFEYLLLHRQIESARRLMESFSVSEITRDKLQKSFEDSTGCPRPTSSGSSLKPGVMLVGPFYVHSSLARINREIAGALQAEDALEVAFEPHSLGEVPGSALPHFDAIAKGFQHRLRRPDLTIRQHWPPDFHAPACGKLVVILPWEYGSIPLRWADRIRRHVDELWVPSEFCRKVFVRGGVQAEKVQVIPYGVDADIFSPGGPEWRPEGCRRFVFLFVGGAILRKGVDVLWEAYRSAFTSDDDVTLVIKDIGSSTFYKGMTLLSWLSRAKQDTGAPHLLTLSEQLDDPTLASLYRGSNAVVLPYRGEGFGLPLAEGLACGRPVITTGLGPARDFCPPEASYFLSARECEIPNAQMKFGPMSGPVTWFEPNVAELSKVMRWVFEHREEAVRRGKFGAEKVRSGLKWPRITNLQLERIRHLVGA